MHSGESFSLSVSVIAFLYKEVEDAKKRQDGKLKLHTQVLTVKDVSVPASHPNSGTCLCLVALDEPKAICQLRARYQRKKQDQPSALKDRAADSSSENDGGVDEEASSGNAVSNEHMMRLLNGWDDLSDDSNGELSPSAAHNYEGETTCEIDAGREVDAMDELNLRIAANSANQEKPGHELENLCCRVADRRDSLGATTSVLNPVEQETEAFLQELLLNKSSEPAHPNETHHDAYAAGAESVDPNLDVDTVINDDEKDAACLNYSKKFVAACAALKHRDETSSRSIDDQRLCESQD